MPVEPSVLMDLHAETPEGEVKQRKAMARGGRPIMKNGAPLMLDYVTARYVQQRLDDVVGPENWQASFKELAGGAIECTISVCVWQENSKSPDGVVAYPVWVGKADVGVPSMIEPAKGAYSDAFKRAGVHWGIARDLYEERDESEVQVPSPVAAPTRPMRERIAIEDDEDFDEPVARPVRRVVQQPLPRERRASDDQKEAALIERWQQDYAADDSPWLCPKHGDAVLVPGGTSQRGKRYGPFLSCPDRDCEVGKPFPFLDALYK